MNQKQHTRMLWSPGASEPVCKIGIAGEFLPSYLDKSPSGEDLWKNKAVSVSPIFADLAVTILNLEGTVGTEGCEPLAKSGSGDILSAPAECLVYLKELGVGIVGIANNHSYDYKEEGARRTMQWLSTMQMRALGFAESIHEPPDTHLWQGPGQARVGFWAAAKLTYSPAVGPGAGVEPVTIRRAAEACKEMRSKGARLCIALLHAGPEKTNHPDPADVDLFRALEDVGFDVVAACHSHRVAGYRQTDRPGTATPAFSFYGLGSLASGIVYSPLEREGLVVVLGIDGRGGLCSVGIRPVLLNREGWGTVPDAVKTRELLGRFDSLSQQIADGSYRAMFYRDMSEGLLRRQYRDFRAAWRRGGIDGVIRKLRRFRLRHVRYLYHKLAGRM